MPQALLLPLFVRPHARLWYAIPSYSIQSSFQHSDCPRNVDGNSPRLLQEDLDLCWTLDPLGKTPSNGESW